MKYKFTVFIESNDDLENREEVKNDLRDWLEINCGPGRDSSWKSVEVE